jgi:signal transduction histidine kinase
MCLAYVVVAIVTELVAYSRQSASLRHGLETRASTDATILAAGAAHPLESRSPGSLSTLTHLVKSIRGAQGVSSAVVYGPNACPLASTDNRRVCSPGLIANTGVSQLPNGDERGTAVINNGPLVLGVAAVVLSGASAQNDLNAALATDTVLRGIGLVLFLALSLMIASYLLGPLTDLSQAAWSIRHGRMGARVPVEGQTEIATVADAFNEMAMALEQRIEHLSFLATSGSALPAAFRDHGDLTAILSEFCRQLEASGVGLIPRDGRAETAIWHDAEPDDQGWRSVAAAAGESTRGAAAITADGRVLMVVPVLGDAVFVAARSGQKPFSDEEQQVITNFAYQLGIAADNARLFEAQQEALQVKDQFLSIVSHELRTPLTTIKGYAQMLHRRLAGDPDGERFANNIDAQVSRLGRLVDDLLDVTRFARGQFELRRQRIELRPVLEDVAARFRVVSPNHTLRLELDDDSYQGYWDRDRLEQVMNNLVSNAIKYSPAGGGVTIATGRLNGEVKISVSDEGVGIPEEEQGHLFERFYRGRGPARDASGLGLGLYVTRRIVEAHGGAITVRSTPNEGSEFSFTLPLARRPVTSVSR